MKRLFTAIILTFILLPFASHALAHAVVATCGPDIGGTVDAPPKELHCSFSQSLATNNAIVVVTNEQRERVDLNDAHVDAQDPRSIVVSLDGAKMPRGYYRVQYAVVSAEDFDLTEGSFYFGIQVVVPPTPTPGAIASIPDTTPVTASRIIPLFIGAAVIVFAGALIVLLRVWRENRYESDR